MVANPSATSVAPNRFNLQPSASTKRGTGFEQQLSTAIAESLRRLGVNPGEVNITIRNSTNSPSATQILITYDAATDPSVLTQTASENGSDSPASSSEVQRQAGTEWSPWNGPRDTRDGIPEGRGGLTASGSPDIKFSAEPVANQYGYKGPAARNPYFTTPSNPLREGYVQGFDNWFTQAFILGSKNGPVPANELLYATEEGAQEALRIVKQFEPGAEITQAQWGGGPFTASLPMYCISLPGGGSISAGGVLANYYNGGAGVTTESDAMLQRSLQMV